MATELHWVPWLVSSFISEPHWSQLGSHRCGLLFKGAVLPAGVLPVPSTGWAGASPVPHSQHPPLFDFCRCSPYKSPKPILQAQDHDFFNSNGMLGSLVPTSDGEALPIHGFPSCQGLWATGTQETTEKNSRVGGSVQGRPVCGGPVCLSFTMSQLEDPE